LGHKLSDGPYGLDLAGPYGGNARAPITLCIDFVTARALDGQPNGRRDRRPGARGPGHTAPTFSVWLIRQGLRQRLSQFQGRPIRGNLAVHLGRHNSADKYRSQQNRIAMTSALTDTVRYCFDALYIKQLLARC
jgi:hypothetical protein